jgi:serine/threonine protein phosphatase PrpC
MVAPNRVLCSMSILSAAHQEIFWEHPQKIGRDAVRLGDRVADLSWAQGKGLRADQEDRLCALLLPGGLLLGAFDGHGTHLVAEIAARELPGIARSAIADARDPEDLLRRIVDALHRRTRHASSGAAATLVFVPESGEHVTVAVLGDCPAIIVGTSGTWVAPEHNVRTNLEEALRSIERGGVCHHGYLFADRLSSIGLQMTRALGDRDLDSVLDREPEVLRVPYAAGDVLLVGTDGLHDVDHDARETSLAHLCGLLSDGADAAALVEDARVRRTRDNASAFVLRLR